MSERIKPRRQHPIFDPWGWMVPRRHDMQVDSIIKLVYDPTLERGARDLMADPPADLEVTCYRLDGVNNTAVEVLHYGHTEGHPHLDVYWSVLGQMAAFHAVEAIKLNFFSTRHGVSLDIVHARGVITQAALRVELSYCPSHDPAVHRYLTDVDKAIYGHHPLVIKV